MSRTSHPPAPDTAALAVELRLVLGRLSRRLRTSGVEGLTPSGLSALATIEEQGSLRLRELAAREGISAPTASKVVDLLAERDLIERSPDPDDHRGTRIALTSGARDLLAAVRSQREAMLADRLARLSGAELERLSTALPVLRALLAEL